MVNVVVYIARHCGIEPEQTAWKSTAHAAGILSVSERICLDVA